MACEDLEELPNREYSDTLASCGHNEIEVAFEIVVSGDEISGVTSDGCSQDVVVVGVAAYAQMPRARDDVSPGHDEAKECFNVLLGVAKLSGEARALKNLAISLSCGRDVTTSNSASNQRETTRPGGPVGLRKADTQTLVSSSATMSTTFRLDLGSRVSHLLLDDLLGGRFGAESHPAKQTLEFVAPLRLSLQCDQDTGPFFQLKRFQGSQNAVLKDRPKSLFHRMAPSQLRQQRHSSETATGGSRQIGRIGGA